MVKRYSWISGGINKRAQPDLTAEIWQKYTLHITTLTESFEPPNSCEICNTQLNRRIRKWDEWLPELVQDIKQSEQNGQPSCACRFKWYPLVRQFYRSYQNDKMKLFIYQEKWRKPRIRGTTKGRCKRLSSAEMALEWNISTIFRVRATEKIKSIKNDIREF